VEEIQRFAKELVALQPDLFHGHTTTATAALRQQTRTIPVIFAFVSDPVGSGLVASFPHPGGNVTGFMVMEPTMAGKWLELLKEIPPRIARVAFLFNPATATHAKYYLKPFKAADASLAQHNMPIASSRAKSRATFPSRPQLRSCSKSILKLRKRSAFRP
jgi:putative ABC transport system substrate-binding protein